MRTTAVVVIGAAMLATGASAQPRGLIDIKVSTDGGITWSHSADGGNRFRVGVFMSVDSGVYGIAGAEFNIVLSGVRAVDTVDISSPGLGRQLPWNFGSSTQEVYRSGDQIRIDAANDSADSSDHGILSRQRDPSSAGVNFSTANPGLVYTFDILVGDWHIWEGGEFSVQASLDQIRGGVMNYYASSSSTRSTATTNLSTQGARVSWGLLPTPGAASAFGVFGVVVAARRRRPVSALSVN